MACWVGNNYRLDKYENFDEYMKALGIGLVICKMDNTVTPTIGLAEDGDEYTLTTLSTFRTGITFKSGEYFHEKTVDGRKVKSVCTFEYPNKFAHEQKVPSAFKNLRL